jgi:hypothetical protein
MVIVNDDSRVINMLEASLTDNARVVIYDRHMFIVQATCPKVLSFCGIFTISFKYTHIESKPTRVFAKYLLNMNIHP